MAGRCRVTIVTQNITVEAEVTSRPHPSAITSSALGKRSSRAMVGVYTGALLQCVLCLNISKQRHSGTLQLHSAVYPGGIEPRAAVSVGKAPGRGRADPGPGHGLRRRQGSPASTVTRRGLGTGGDARAPSQVCFYLLCWASAARPTEGYASPQATLLSLWFTVRNAYLVCPSRSGPELLKCLEFPK